MPDPDKPGAGFPILDGATHTRIFAPEREDGAYNRHSQLIAHNEAKIREPYGTRRVRSNADGGDSSDASFLANWAFTQLSQV